MRSARHGRAILLLGGWLLMLPPTTEEGAGNFNLGAPIEQWVQFQAFDTASACEIARSQSIATVERMYPQAPQKGMLPSGFRCIPAEHIYPPKPPVAK